MEQKLEKNVAIQYGSGMDIVTMIPILNLVDMTAETVVGLKSIRIIALNAIVTQIIQDRLKHAKNQIGLGMDTVTTKQILKYAIMTGEIAV